MAQMDKPSFYCVKLTERKSFAWRYFGLLVKAEDYDQCIDNDHVYCSVCFQSNLPNVPTSVTNVITLVKRYKRNVATGNLLLHLKKNHNIQSPPAGSPAENNNIVNLFSHLKELSTPAKPLNKAAKPIEAPKCNKLNETQKPPFKGKFKNALCRDLALWICQDMLSFHLTSNHGFIEFAKKYRISGGNELPEPASILKYALSDIYQTAYSVVKKEVLNSPAVVSVTMDSWTDVPKQLSFITFTLHFVSMSFVTKTLTLRTCILPHPYVVQNIHNEIKKTIEQFDLKSKTVICITAEGTNIFKACALSNIDCYNCVSYALHSLVICDGLNDTPEVKRAIVKAREILRHLGFRMNDLPQEHHIQYREFICKLIEISEILDEDARFPLIFQQTPSQLMATASSNCAQECPTRWTCILSLLEILVRNDAAVNLWLNTLNICELILSEQEWNLIKEVSEVLSALRTASEVLSGCQFPSLNLALLFRAEILCSLQPDLVDSKTVGDFKRNMLHAAETKFPVSELQLCAALLDPSLRGLQVIDEYLCQNSSNKERFLKKMYESYISEKFEESLCESPVASPYVEQPSSWKKIKLELLQKHAVTHRLGVAAEIQQYLSVTTNVDDPLMWWKDHEGSFPRLACLAKYILGIPSTSIPSERAFSVNDVLWNSKRMTISPTVVDKTLFIHENCNDTVYSVMFAN